MSFLAKMKKKQVEKHLRNCNSCSIEYRKLIKFFEMLKGIPFTIDIPADLVGKLTSELIEESIKDNKATKHVLNVRKIKNEQLKQEEKLKNTRGAIRKSKTTRSISKSYATQILPVNTGFTFKNTLLMLIPIFFIAIGYLVYDFTLINSPWKVKSINGVHYINGFEDYKGLWNKGETLTTKENVITIVSIPNTGKLEVHSNSSILLEQAKDGDNKIKLNRGEIKIINSSVLPDLMISLKDLIIYNRGGIINISLNNQTGKVHVEYGLAEIKTADQNILVGEGYIFEFLNNNTNFIPYRADASDSLKLILLQNIYQKGSDADVEKAIKISRSKDMLSLLALIPYVSASKRGILFQAIANNFPPPSSVTFEGIIKLNKKMLLDWWYEIEWQI